MDPRTPLALAAMLATAAWAPTAARADAPSPVRVVGEDQPDALAIPAPSQAAGATTARIVSPTFARRRLASSARGWPVSTQTSWSRQQQTLLVLASTVRDGREWLKVLLPVRPNGSAGWLPRDRVILGRTRYWIDVRTRTRRVTVYRDGTSVRSFRAVVGAPRTPTPGGLAAVYERNRQPDPSGFLGPWVLSLTSLSTVLEDYGGGPGRVALHGRGGASLLDPLGSARSHGCVRLDNADVSWLAGRIPVATPVRVRR